MTIEWLAGNRLRGTTAERPVLGLPSGSVGGWVEVGRTTLDGASATIDVSSIPDKRYYMILMDYTQTSDFSGLHRLGNSSIDTGNNYHNRQSTNGGTTAASQASYLRVDNGWQSGDRKFAVEYIVDKTNKEKLIMNHMVRSVTTGASQDPQRSEVSSKWVPTTASDTISKFQMMNGGTYADGSEVVVLGWDPTDTHTTNFWEELASVELSSASNSISTGTFTPKKYMWLQYHIPSSTGSANNYDLRVGNNTIDSGSNRYAFKYNINGANGDTSVPNQNTLKLSFNMGSGSEWSFGNVFIINNASTEKLFISQANRNNVSGAGTAPNRHNVTGKWIESTNQINIMELFHQTGASTLGAGTIMKVWGSD